MRAVQGDVVCRRKLGDLFYFGQGVGVNHSGAARHYSLNHLDAQSTFNLAWLTERGLGVPEDRERAKALYARATELGGHGLRRRLAFEASDAEFSALPAQLLVSKMEAQDELCAFASDVVALLPEIPGASGWARAAVGGACAGAAGGGGADGSHEWLALWGVRLEWMVAAAVGLCTLCSSAMGPCCVGCRFPPHVPDTLCLTL